jgi:hypothetical protein
MARIDREWITIEALKVVNTVLKNSFTIGRKNPFRNPTKKELSRHPKLIEKQRRYLKPVS